MVIVRVGGDFNEYLATALLPAASFHLPYLLTLPLGLVWGGGRGEIHHSSNIRSRKRTGSRQTSAEHAMPQLWIP